MLQDISSDVAEQRRRLLTIVTSGPDVLSIRPEGNKWSINDCMIHMSLATELYLDQIEEKLHMLRPLKSSYKPTFLANYFINSLAPQANNSIRFKMKTLKAFDPHHKENLTSAEPSERLLNNLDRIDKIVEACSDKDLRSFKVTTALGPILRFYLGDALRFICAHNERHVLQIRNIMTALKINEDPSAQV